MSRHFFGVVGYVFKKLNYPIAPLVLAMVLGDKSEDAFRQSMLLSEGSLSIFVSSGIAGTITLMALLLAWALPGKRVTLGKSGLRARLN